MSTVKSGQKTSDPGIAGFLVGLALVVVLAFIARWAKIQVYGASLPFGIPGKVLEYPLWAAIIGLVVNWILEDG